MIKRAEEMSFGDSKFTMILYGSPGLGKTTLALSAPVPVLIDFDRGIKRVNAAHRKLTLVCANYEEVIEDMKSPEIRDCQTIVIDTGGSFVTFLQDWAIRQSTSNATKGGKVSQQGWGAVKSEFVRFSNHLRDVLNKNVIYVFHSTEDKSGEATVQRLQCEGSARNIVWQPADLGGYMEMVGNKRYVSFTPEESFFAKGCYGIVGRREVPTLAQSEKNDFLTRLFDEARTFIANEAEAFSGAREQYAQAVATGTGIVETIEGVDTANAAMESMKNIEHALTSRKEVNSAFNGKIRELGLFYDKVLGRYTPAPPEEASA